MKFSFSEPYLLKSKRFFDKRGFFQELYLKKKICIQVKFTALAYSKKNVIRGMHFQIKNKQTKIISIISGEILDVAINLKKNSKKFGKIYYFHLKEGDTIVVPNFYAHGYECLSKKASIIYHSDSYRDTSSEHGIPFNDKYLKIKWHTKSPNISKRDKSHRSFLEFKKKYKGL